MDTADNDAEEALLTWVGKEAERSTLTAAIARGLPSTGDRAYGMAL